MTSKPLSDADHKYDHLGPEEPLKERIHVCPWRDSNAKYNEKRIKEQNPSLNSKNAIDDYFVQQFQFLEEDDVETGDWILTWRAKDDDFPHSSAKIEWMYINDVIPHGYSDDEIYTSWEGKWTEKANWKLRLRSRQP